MLTRRVLTRRVLSRSLAAVVAAQPQEPMLRYPLLPMAGSTRPVPEFADYLVWVRSVLEISSRQAYATLFTSGRDSQAGRQAVLKP